MEKGGDAAINKDKQFIRWLDSVFMYLVLLSIALNLLTIGLAVFVHLSGFSGYDCFKQFAPYIIFSYLMEGYYYFRLRPKHIK